jgi:hypothetical protein
MFLFLQILLVLVTGAIVFFTAYYLLKMFFENESKKRMTDYKTQNMKLITPVKLQAYERIILLLERISPNSLMLRLQVPGMEARQLQKEMLSLIRAEFEHNLSQQIYMSDKAWDIASSAKENVVKLINLSSQKVAPEAPAMELSNLIMDTWMGMNPTPTQTAIGYIKSEINTVF